MPPATASAPARQNSRTYIRTRRTLAPRLRGFLPFLPFLASVSGFAPGAFFAAPAGPVAAAVRAGGRLLGSPEPDFRLPATSHESTQPAKERPTRRARRNGRHTGRSSSGR